MPVVEVGSGWSIGYIVGGVVILAVALLVTTLILLARRIGTRAEQITRALVVARDNTEPLWEIDTTNRLAQDILAGAAQAREALGGGGPGPRRAPQPPGESPPPHRIDVT